MQNQDPQYMWTRRRKKVHFFFRRKWTTLQIGIGFVFILMLIVSVIRLCRYGFEYFSAVKASNELRAAYYDMKQDSSGVDALYQARIPENTAAALPAVTESIEYPQNAATPPAPTASVAPATLEKIHYPNNKYAIISNQFAKIRRQNNDIIGWITIDDVLDEAVVQRDNTYYLRRDYRGYHNTNGALFLDENCDLSTRPYTMMIYGHNMKTGAMFGSLRNYENISFYKNNPFFRLDTAYEEGRYVIFAISNISTDVNHYRYFSFGSLLSMTISDRQYAIEQLKRFSIYKTQIDVAAGDQIVLLITCMGDDTERRIVAARRIRDNEDEESLLSIISKTRKK